MRRMLCALLCAAVGAVLTGCSTGSEDEVRRLGRVNAKQNAALQGAEEQLFQIREAFSALAEKNADMDRVLDDLRAACERNGRDFDSIKKSHFFGVVTASDHAGVERILQEMADKSGRSADEERSRYRGAVGVPEEVAEVFKQYVDLGVEQFMLVFPFGHEAESVKLLAERAMPSFKE